MKYLRSIFGRHLGLVVLAIAFPAILMAFAVFADMRARCQGDPASSCPDAMSQTASILEAALQGAELAILVLVLFYGLSLLIGLLKKGAIGLWRRWRSR